MQVPLPVFDASGPIRRPNHPGLPLATRPGPAQTTLLVQAHTLAHIASPGRETDVLVAVPLGMRSANQRDVGLGRYDRAACRTSGVPVAHQTGRSRAYRRPKWLGARPTPAGTCA